MRLSQRDSFALKRVPINGNRLQKASAPVKSLLSREIAESEGVKQRPGIDSQQPEL